MNYQEPDFNEFYDDWIECPNCGGEGFLDDRCECERIVDICFCENPTPQKCRQCNGEGGCEHNGVPNDG